MPIFDNFKPTLKHKGPILTALTERKTFILDEPLLVKLGIDPSPQLPSGVTREEAIDVLRETWGKKLASGLADRAGLTGLAREQFIENWSRVVAEGLLRGV